MLATSVFSFSHNVFYSTLSKTEIIIYVTFILSSANAFNLDKAKFLWSENRLNPIFHGPCVFSSHLFLCLVSLPCDVFCLNCVSSDHCVSLACHFEGMICHGGACFWNLEKFDCLWMVLRKNLSVCPVSHKQIFLGSLSPIPLSLKIMEFRNIFTSPH